MTAQSFAAVLQARPNGTGRWQARCPAHEDRLPSLNIREGREGRVLLHCFAGCTTKAVMKAAGLSISDLFVGLLPTPEQVRIAAQERTVREAEALQARRENSKLTAQYRKLEAVWEAIAARMVKMPDDVAATYALARLFHHVQDRVREIEAVFEAQESQIFRARMMPLEEKPLQIQETA